MADPIQPCNCSPHINICCCGPQNGIDVIQPACQTLPDGRVVNNPAFSVQTATSFWTYKFITDCDQLTRGISVIGIPVCESIQSDSVTVFEKVDGCGNFVSVPFTLIENDPNFGIAPTGYQWLKIESSDRYDKGVCVEYRLQITGDYPTDVQPIIIRAHNSVLTFDCGCFLVPRCNPTGELSVTKTCGHILTDNQVALIYEVKVSNTGNAPLDNVQYLDTIFISPILGIGTITVSPPTLDVNTSVLGQITISGNLGTINPGETVVITYLVPITTIPSARRYITNNTATATAAGTMDMATCSTNLNAVQVSVDKCCSISDTNSASFTFTISSVGDSPDTFVNVRDHLSIPAGVTVRFTSFGGCTATLEPGGTPVPLNTDITGPTTISIACDNLPVHSTGSSSRTVSFSVVSSTVFDTSTINNAVSSVVLSDPDSAIFLGAGQLPVEADIDVSLNAICGQPCS